VLVAVAWHCTVVYIPVAHDLPSINVEEALTEGVRLLVEQGYIRVGDRVILTMGEQTGNQGGTNSLRLIQVGEGGYSEYNPSLEFHRP